ncbi:hypothetical protein [Streptomyces milbemycinicus]|uniref:Uncharacterized protein n=1 Tax=Streptomyces milbemycinicus TaxID=476552 RepID=A0ABW8M307_9ACTN
MADSERPGDRDEGVPDPRNRDHVPPDSADKGDEGSCCRGHAEPDRGSASLRLWIQVIGEILPWLIRILEFAHDSGG